MNWNTAYTAGAIALGCVLTFDIWKWRKKMAEHVVGLLQKFREAVPMARENVDRLVALNASQAETIAKQVETIAAHGAELVARDAEIAELKAGAADSDGKVYITGEEFDEASNLVADVQNLGTAASMPLPPKG